MNSLSHKFNQHRLTAVNPKDHRAGFTLTVEPQSKLPLLIWGREGAEIGLFNKDNKPKYYKGRATFGSDWAGEYGQLTTIERRVLKRQIIANVLIQRLPTGSTREYDHDNDELLVEVIIRKYDDKTGDMDDTEEWAALTGLATQLMDYDIPSGGIEWDGTDEGPACYLTIQCADQLRVRNYARIDKD